MSHRFTPSLFRHLHSNALQHLDILIAEKELPAFEITVDDGGPGVAVIAEAGEKVQQAGKPLIIHGTLTSEETITLCRALDPYGLYIASRAYSAHDEEVMSL
jgi:hypothetical protein